MSRTVYALDTNVLIHDPNAPLNFHEHLVLIPMVVLEELDHLKVGKQTVAADCRQAIRLIDRLLGSADNELVAAGVPIQRANGPEGELAILMDGGSESTLTDDLNDNKIINHLLHYKRCNLGVRVVLVTKDINMRLKARACGLEAEDYSTDKLVDDIALLPRGYHEFPAFWDIVQGEVDTVRMPDGAVHHMLAIPEQLLGDVHLNQYILDDGGFVGQVKDVHDGQFLLHDLSFAKLMDQEVWGLKPRDIYQALALHALMDPDTHLVNLTGSAGSGKTILALAAAIEQTISTKRYRRIIATRSVQGLDEDIGFLPGTEAEKMEPWLGAIVDNLEALHAEDENSISSIDYILQKVPLQFKSLNFIRGRSFQHSLLLIDECQNLTPHQMKTIITRAGTGTKVICLGNLAQIDTPHLSAPSSGLTYLVERFKGFQHGAQITLQGVPRSVLAEFAERKM